MAASAPARVPTTDEPVPVQPDAPAPSRVDLAAYFAYADQLRNQGHLEQALAAILPMRQDFPQRADVRVRLGIVLYSLHRYSEAREELESAVGQDPENGEAFKFLTGCYQVLGLFDEAIRAARRTVELLPADSQVRNVLGTLSLRSGRVEEALENFHTALELNSDDVFALTNLEITRVRFGGARLAGIHREHSSAVRTRYIDTLSAKLAEHALTLAEADLLCTLVNCHREYLPQALELTRQFAKRVDLTADLAVNLSVVLQNVGQLQEAMHLRQRAFDLAPGSVEARSGLGALWITEGKNRWFEGWRLVGEASRNLNPRNYPLHVPSWTGQDLRGQRLFVHMDQGFGDALLGLRCLPYLAKKNIKVVLWVRRQLGELARSATGYDELLISEEPPEPFALGCSHACGLLELIAPLALEREQIKQSPRLQVPKAAQQKWADRIAALPGKRIALAALGNNGRIDDWLRSIPLEALEPLLTLAGVSWINLSVDPRAEKTALCERFAMFDPTPEFADFSDAAAVIEAADALITIDGSVAHVAGAIGKPFWLLKPTLLDWRWQIDGELSPWWEGVEVVRAEGPGEWTEAIQILRRELIESLERTGAPNLQFASAPDSTAPTSATPIRKR